MNKLNGFILKFPVPIVAVLVVILQLFFVSNSNLTRWKGGGFGMYSEMHFYYNQVVVNNLNIPLDSLKASDQDIAKAAYKLRRIPSTGNLKMMANLLSQNMTTDTLTVQVWKPRIDSQKATYTRELINEFHYLKQ